MFADFEANMGWTSKPHWRGPTHQAYLVLWWPFSIFTPIIIISFHSLQDNEISWLKTWRMQCCCGFEAGPWKSRGLLTSRGSYHKISSHTPSISQTWQGIAFQVRRGTLSGIAKAVQCQSCHLCLCHEFSVTVSKYVLWALDQPVVSCQLREHDKNLCLSVFRKGTRRPQMPGWLEASLKLGLRRPQLSTDRSHGLLAANRLAEKASKFQSNYINPIIKINLTLAGTVVSQKA